MRITIFNGTPESATVFQEYLHTVAQRLIELGNELTIFDLTALEVKGCMGCWGCWVKTPGECARRDDSAQLCRAAIGSDLLLLASPLVMGFTTAILKRAADQLIPLIHPYFVVEGGETHHRARYDRYPKLGLLISAGSDSDAEDIEITTAMWKRTARNLKSKLVFNAVANHGAEEVADEIIAAA